MASSPWEPGTLPPGEEAEQGNPGMFLSKSLIPRLLHSTTTTKISPLKFHETSWGLDQGSALTFCGL